MVAPAFLPCQYQLCFLGSTSLPSLPVSAFLPWQYQFLGSTSSFLSSTQKRPCMNPIVLSVSTSSRTRRHRLQYNDLNDDAKKVLRDAAGSDIKIEF